MGFYETFGQITVWFLIFWIVFKLLKGLWQCVIANSIGLGVQWKGSPDNWAVITGATDGIGLEFAKEMARKGYSLLLISRTYDKLETVKDEIKSKCSNVGTIRTLAADFSRMDIYDDIKREIESIDNIDVLINNVGISYSYPEYFDQIPDADNFIESIINVNIISCTKMMHMILPKMEKQKRGIIVNLSSFAASYPTPLLSLYSATKVYVDYLSRALQIEYADKGIIIQSVLPLYVSTKMSKIRKTSLMVPSAPHFVRSVLDNVGIETRTYGFWTHKLQGFVQDSIIGNILGTDFNMKLSYDSLKDVRRRYFKKQQNLKEKNN